MEYDNLPFDEWETDNQEPIPVIYDLHSQIGIKIFRQPGHIMDEVRKRTMALIEEDSDDVKSQIS